jgi:RimJ/RimL family protein N-acetyltransferase
MSVTSQHRDVSNNNQSGQSEAEKKAMPDWTKVTPVMWQEQLARLVESYIDPKDRLYWMLSMRDWLQANLQCVDNASGQSTVQYSMAETDDDTLESNLRLMCELAYKLCDWVVIIKVHEYLDKLPEETTSVMANGDVEQQLIIQYLQLAVAYWQMGQLDNAEAFLRQKLQQLPPGTPLTDFYQHIQHDIARMVFESEIRQEDDLLLMPLEEQHLSGFSLVYDDPQIAKLCNLPDFSDDEQWFNWLDIDQNNAHKHVFAVIHKQWGLIGSVSIEVHDGVGFFYYWLGQDFQGGGLGPKAVLMLLQLAECHMGMKCCYAKAFEHNLPSQKAMAKMGFQILPFKVVADGDNQVYFYRGTDRPVSILGEELLRLAALTDAGSEIQVKGYLDQQSTTES